MMSDASPRTIGRYLLFGEIASGGMATVHFGRLSGPAGFSRTVCIKRLHPQYAKDPEFVSMFLDEARLAARIRHPNVVTTLDVVTTGDEIFLVMEYVQGESLARLFRAVRSRMKQADPRVVSTIMSGVLHGLHAAHEARDEQGKPLHIVHRDVSPQNILVGVDGVARVLDFGVAKAGGRVQTTREGQIKGKIAYMAPEQLHGAPVTRQTDVYAAAVVAWESLTLKRLFHYPTEAALVTAILHGTIPPPSQAAPDVPAAFDRVVMRGLERDVTKRYATAREMAVDMEKCIGLATPSEVGDWVESIARDDLQTRAMRIAEIESASSSNAISVLPMGDPSSGPTLDAPHVPEAAGSGRRSLEIRSDLSSIAVSPPSLMASRRGPSRTALVAGAGVAAGLIALATLLLSARGEHSHPPSDIAASTAAPAAPAACAGPTSPLPAPVETVSVETLPVSALPTARPVPDTPTRRRFVAPAPVPMQPTPTPTRNGGAAIDCDPPFSIDEKGHKHFKPACLQ